MKAFERMERACSLYRTLRFMGFSRERSRVAFWQAIVKGWGI